MCNSAQALALMASSLSLQYWRYKLSLTSILSGPFYQSYTNHIDSEPYWQWTEICRNKTYLYVCTLIAFWVGESKVPPILYLSNSTFRSSTFENNTINYLKQERSAVCSVMVFGKQSWDRQYSTQVCLMLYCQSLDLSPHIIILPTALLSCFSYYISSN